MVARSCAVLTVATPRTHGCSHDCCCDDTTMRVQSDLARSIQRACTTLQPIPVNAEIGRPVVTSLPHTSTVLFLALFVISFVCFFVCCSNGWTDFASNRSLTRMSLNVKVKGQGHQGQKSAPNTPAAIEWSRLLHAAVTLTFDLWPWYSGVLHAVYV